MAKASRIVLSVPFNLWKRLPEVAGRLPPRAPTSAPQCQGSMKEGRGRGSRLSSGSFGWWSGVRQAASFQSGESLGQNKQASSASSFFTRPKCPNRPIALPIPLPLLPLAFPPHAPRFLLSQNRELGSSARPSTYLPSLPTCPLPVAHSCHAASPCDR